MFGCGSGLRLTQVGSDPGCIYSQDFFSYYYKYSLFSLTRIITKYITFQLKTFSVNYLGNITKWNHIKEFRKSYILQQILKKTIQFGLFIFIALNC